MKLVKKKEKIWLVITIIAGIGLILTSLLPALYSIFR
jgi:hypothetical protein